MTSVTERYLAWDTSSVTGVISAFEITNGELREVVSWSLSLDTSRHSERLLWSIDTVLQSAGWTINDIKGIAVGVGPGSFTGLRIGIATARMLAKTLGIPVIPISSLALLARGVVDHFNVVSDWASKEKKSIESILILACTDATKGEWFTLSGNLKSVRDCISFADGDLPGIWGRGVIEGVLTPDEVIEHAKKHLKKAGASARWIAVGSSVKRYEEVFKQLPVKSRVKVENPALHQVQVSSISRLAFEAIQQGLLRESDTLKPRYLRASEAEVKLQKGLLKPNPVHHRGGVA